MNGDEASPGPHPANGDTPTTPAQRGWGFRSALALARLAGQALHLATRTARIFGQGHAFNHAAAISFFALLSALPFLILLVSAIGYLAYVAGPESDAVSAILARLGSVLARFSPVASDALPSLLDTVIARRGQFGLFGAGVMILGGSMVFGAIEAAVKELFAVPKRRRFLVSRAIFSALLVAVGIVLFLGHYLLTMVDSFLLTLLGTTLEAWLDHHAILNAALTLIPVPLTFLAILYLPGIARPPFRYGLMGSLLFFLLWEIAREAFAWYVTNLSSMDVLYGSMATPIVIMIWTYYAASILLFAFAFVAALNREEMADHNSDGDQKAP